MDVQVMDRLPSVIADVGHGAEAGVGHAFEPCHVSCREQDLTENSRVVTVCGTE